MSTEHSATPAPGYRDKNSTADRALTILSLFTEHHTVVSAAEITEALGVARSTAYRYAQTLTGAGFLEEVPGHGFQLGHRILELALIARRSQGYSEVAGPSMRELVDRFHHTVVLSRLSGTAVICLEKEEWAESHVRISVERGSVADLNAGASAIALLAQLPEREATALLESRPLRGDGEVAADPDSVAERLRAAREEGFVIGHGTVDARTFGIAVPIASRRGPIALAVVAIGAVPDGEVGEIVDALTRAGNEIGERLALLDG